MGIAQEGINVPIQMNQGQMMQNGPQNVGPQMSQQIIYQQMPNQMQPQGLNSFFLKN